MIAISKRSGNSSDWREMGEQLWRAISNWYQWREIISTDCTWELNQTWSHNYLTRGLHVIELCRLTWIMFWFLPQSQNSVHFYVHFVFQSMSLKYLQGLHPPICDFKIKWIFQKSHLHLGRKNMDIVASSIFSAYDVNKTQNIILKVPWFHTPDSQF